jgi:diadenosine tetraphosphatase ApaH/serine/threonine PP2A family protein phosphatase
VRATATAAYNAMNETFQWLSPAAVVERCILCVHGGIGRIKWLRQLESLTKPCAGVQELMEAQDSRGALLTDVL